jgi:hypothetical protein
MGFDPEFDKDGFAKGDRNHARLGGLVALAAFTALAMLFAICSRSRPCPSGMFGWASPQASGDGIGRPPRFATKHVVR